MNNIFLKYELNLVNTSITAWLAVNTAFVLMIIVLLFKSF